MRVNLNINFTIKCVKIQHLKWLEFRFIMNA